MAIEIQIDQTSLDNAVQRMHGIPHALEQALYPAMSQIISEAHSNIRDALKSTVPLPKKTINKATRIQPLKQASDGFIGSISIYSSGIPLIEYDAQPAEITARKGVRAKNWTGFTYALRAGERRESAENIEGAGLPFIAETKNGHLGVFYRTGYRSTRDPKKWAIKQSYGPSVQYHFTPEIEQDIADITERRLPRVFARFVDQVIAQHGGTK